MSLYILDTDMLSLLQHGHPVVWQRIATVPPGDVAVTIITVEEQFKGRLTSLRRARDNAALALAYAQMTETMQGLASLRILSFPEPSITRFEQLVSLKLNIGRNDLRIAAIALEQGATVVTRNTRDFGRVPGLTIEDWSV